MTAADIAMVEAVMVVAVDALKTMVVTAVKVGATQI
jgi:hypothetical protein